MIIIIICMYTNPVLTCLKAILLLLYLIGWPNLAANLHEDMSMLLN